MAVIVPVDIKELKDIRVIYPEGNEPCLAGYSHCFGSDGGSGIPQNMKVAPGRGGDQEVWTLSTNKNKIDKKEIYSRCQFCLKYLYVQDKE